MATQAVERLQKRLEKDPNPSVFLQLAEEYRKEGLNHEALRVCQDGLKRYPNHWSVRAAMGRIHRQMGNRAEARQELEKVVKAVPDNLLANKLLGDIYMEMGLDQDALQRYRIVQMMTPADQDVLANIEQLESRVVAEAEEPARTSPAEPSTPPVETPVAPTLQIPVPLPELTQLDEKEEPIAVDSNQELAAVEEKESFQEEPQPEENFLSALEQEMLGDRTDPGLAQGAAFMLNTEVPSGSEDTSIPLEEEEASDEMYFMELDTSDSPAMDLHSASTKINEDHTQPMQEKEESVEQADELTTETLAELYVQQGLVDKAIKVYQKILLNQPNNVQVMQKLKQLGALDVVRSTVSEQPAPTPELAPVMQEADWTGLSSSQNSRNLSDERRRKITTLENWLAAIRRERS